MGTGDQSNIYEDPEDPSALESPSFMYNFNNYNPNFTNRGNYGYNYGWKSKPRFFNQGYYPYGVNKIQTPRRFSYNKNPYTFIKRKIDFGVLTPTSNAFNPASAVGEGRTTRSGYQYNSFYISIVPGFTRGWDQLRTSYRQFRVTYVTFEFTPVNAKQDSGIVHIAPDHDNYSVSNNPGEHDVNSIRQRLEAMPGYRKNYANSPFIVNTRPSFLDTVYNGPNALNPNNSLTIQTPVYRVFIPTNTGGGIQYSGIRGLWEVPAGVVAPQLKITATVLMTMSKPNVS